jgi:hypothetical protein
MALGLRPRVIAATQGMVSGSSGRAIFYLSRRDGTSYPDRALNPRPWRKLGPLLCARGDRIGAGRGLLRGVIVTSFLLLRRKSEALPNL